ncbi:hypothetical protein SAMN05444672_11539 [Bacillus sp. OK838]|nr:hypothetical protein SAMN05444672_11539 [Bacillus sp. OK838]
MPLLNDTLCYIVDPMAVKKAEEILKSKAVPYEVFFTREKRQR